MNISEVSNFLGVSDSTLRQWERELDVYIPRNNGAREYGDKEIDLLMHIKRLRDEGKGYLEIKIELEKNNYIRGKDRSNNDKLESEKDMKKLIHLINNSIEQMKGEFNDKLIDIESRQRETDQLIGRIFSKSIETYEIADWSSKTLKQLYSGYVDFSEVLLDAPEMDCIMGRYTAQLREEIESSLENNIKSIKEMLLGSNNQIKEEIRIINNKILDKSKEEKFKKMNLISKLYTGLYKVK